jgi:DNA invertase Pin-like site-specific DNA recombinase
MAWSVDRLGRSLQDLVGFCPSCTPLASTILHQQGLDTSTPSGRAMFQMIGVFAEFERSMIQERVLAGMSRAAASGTRSGKPIGRPRIEPETEASIRAALEKGDVGMRKVAVQFGVATGTVQRIAREVGASVVA